MSVSAIAVELDSAPSTSRKDNQSHTEYETGRFGVHEASIEANTAYHEIANNNLL